MTAANGLNRGQLDKLTEQIKDCNPCRACNGTGQLLAPDNISDDCIVCGGEGKIINHTNKKPAISLKDVHEDLQTIISQLDMLYSFLRDN